MNKEIEIEKIRREIKYNSEDGIHTFTMCECGRSSCRSRKCNICLREELNELDKVNKKGISKK